MDNYDVKIEAEKIGDKTYTTLLVTHNLYSWTGVRIVNPEHEIPKMIKVLEDHLRKVKEV